MHKRIDVLKELKKFFRYNKYNRTYRDLPERVIKITKEGEVLVRLKSRAVDVNGDTIGSVFDQVFSRKEIHRIRKINKILAERRLEKRLARLAINTELSEDMKIICGEVFDA